MKKTSLLILALSVATTLFSFLSFIRPFTKETAIFNRHWLGDGLQLLYTENTLQQLKFNVPYMLSFRIGNKLITDTFRVNDEASGSLPGYSREMSYSIGQHPTIKNRCSSKDRLFVVSPWDTDNGNNYPSHNTVIDIYHTANGRYEGSIYIPYIRNTPPRVVRISDGFIIALYKNAFSIYTLSI